MITDIALQRENRQAIFLFTIDSERNVILAQAGGIAHSINENSVQENLLRELLPIDNPEIGRAINSSFEGLAGLAQYDVGQGNQRRRFEFHSLPVEFGSNKASCLLIERTSELDEASKLQRKIEVLDIISQAVKAFAETRNLSEVLRIILLSVTAGPGLGFNRGFVLLSNESRTHLWGCLAIGPSTPEEAGIIWNNLSQRSLSLEEILKFYKTTSHNTEDIHVNKLVASLKIPLNDDDNVIIRAIKEGRSTITTPDIMLGASNQSLRERFGTDCMAIVPLLSREGLQGALLADNLITGKPITDAHLNVLEIFARYASDAIENSRLYGKLEQQIYRLKEANEKIIQTRENLIRAEKLSSVAKMALDVAHEIRNPLTVIGGYAIAYLKKAAPDDPSRKILDIITKQAGRIESALDRFSSVVSMSEKKDVKYNLINLVRESLGILSTSSSPDQPNLSIDSDSDGMCIVIDKGLFYQAMMVIFRKAAEVAGGPLNFSVHAVKSAKSGIIFILGGDNLPRFAEEYYRSLKDPNGGVKGQEIAVALEILQHYGGSLGVTTGENGMMHFYVEFTLCEEE
jgi:signal transduction histidine kinase